MEIYRECTPFPPAELEKYRGLTWNGVSVYSILQAYSICLVQPNQAVIRADGMIATYIVEEAVAYLKKNTF